MTYSCVIIDDQPYAVDSLKKYVEASPDLHLVGSYTDPIKALKELSIGPKLDLILLDVEMPLINGLDLARDLRSNTRKLVFTTSYSKYAYEAFELVADGFLLKPFTFAKFMSVVNRLFPSEPHPNQPDFFSRETRGQDRALIREDNMGFVFVKNKADQKLIKINFRDIVMIESKKNYIQVTAKNTAILTYMSLIDLAKKLEGIPEFLQIQRSFIINLNFIEYIEGNTLKMIGGIKITVGKIYRAQFTAFITRRLLIMEKKKIIFPISTD